MYEAVASVAYGGGAGHGNHRRGGYSGGYDPEGGGVVMGAEVEAEVAVRLASFEARWEGACIH